MPYNSAVASQDDKSNVSTRDPFVERMRPKLDLVETLMGGLFAMQRAGKTYLPQEAKESDTAYQVRLNRSSFFNAYRKTVESMTGRPFSKPVQIDEEKLPKEVVEWLKDVDNTGRDFQTFAYDFFSEGLADGGHLVYIEYPDARTGTGTASDDINFRPYLKQIDAQQIIGCHYHVEGGQTTLDQFRFWETVTEQDGEWATKEISQVRVLNVGSWEVWREEKRDGREEWIKVDEGKMSLPFIPLVVFYTGRVGFMEFEPPLLDLAHENVAHWQSMSDQKHILHVARVPILFVKGWALTSKEGQPQGLEVGPNSVQTTEEPNADMKYVEHTGAAVEAGRRDIEDIENRMAVLGAELLVKSATVQRTATENVLSAEVEYSALGVMTSNAERVLSDILWIMAQWKGLTMEKERIVTLNTDFGSVTRGDTDLATLLSSVQAGLISHKTYLYELQRRKVIDPQLDVEKELEQTSMQTPFGDPNAPGNGSGSQQLKSLQARLADVKVQLSKTPNDEALQAEAAAIQLRIDKMNQQPMIQ